MWKTTEQAWARGMESRPNQISYLTGLEPMVARCGLSYQVENRQGSVLYLRAGRHRWQSQLAEADCPEPDVLAWTFRSDVAHSALALARQQYHRTISPPLPGISTVSAPPRSLASWQVCLISTMGMHSLFRRQHEVLLFVEISQRRQHG